MRMLARPDTSCAAFGHRMFRKTCLDCGVTQAALDYAEYVDELRCAESVGELNHDDADARDWVAIARAEDIARDNACYDPEAQADLAYPTYEEMRAGAWLS